MKKLISKSKDSPCLPDCSKIKYSVVDSSSQLSTEALLTCSDIWTMDNLNLIKESISRESELPEWSEKLIGSGTAEERFKAVCTANIQNGNLNVVNLFIKTTSAVRIMKEKGVTLVGVVSTLGKILIAMEYFLAFCYSGGTLGLFCGLSILSMAEMIIWATMVLPRRV